MKLLKLTGFSESASGRIKIWDCLGENDDFSIYEAR